MSTVIHSETLLPLLQKKKTEWDYAAFMLIRKKHSNVFGFSGTYEIVYYTPRFRICDNCHTFVTIILSHSSCIWIPTIYSRVWYCYTKADYRVRCNTYIHESQFCHKIRFIDWFLVLEPAPSLKLPARLQLTIAANITSPCMRMWLYTIPHVRIIDYFIFISINNNYIYNELNT